jgi:MFS family permease
VSHDHGADGEAGYPRAGLAWYAVGVLTVGWVLAYLDRQIIVILIESLRRDLSFNDTQASLLQGFAFSLFFVLAGLPLGRLVDVTNRRNLLLAGILIWSLMTMACGLATNFWQLFAARLGVGVGEACLAPASVSLVADLIRPNRRGAAMGVMVSGAAIGNAGSALLGGLILQVLGPKGGIDLPLLGHTAPWQVAFFVVGAPGLLVSALMLTFREPERRERAEGGNGASFRRYFAKRPTAIVLTYLMLTCNMIVGYGVAIWGPVVLLRVHHLPPGQVGLIVGAILLIAGPLGSSVGGLLSDAFTRRFGPVGRLGVMMITFPAMLVAFSLWMVFDGVIASIIAFTVLAPVIGQLVNGSSYPALNQLVPNEMRGQLIAVYLLIGNMAGLGIAPTAVALITDYVFKDPGMLKYSLACIGLPFAVLGFLALLFAIGPYRRATAVAASQAAA